MFVDFAAAAVYPPVPYIPSAIGIRVGRLFGASPFVLVLLARLAELAAFIALGRARDPAPPDARVGARGPRAHTGRVVPGRDGVGRRDHHRARARRGRRRARAHGARRSTTCPAALLIETVLVTLALALSQAAVLPRGRACCCCRRGGIGARSARCSAATLGGRRRARARVDALGQRSLPRARLPAAVARRPRELREQQRAADASRLAYLRSHPFAFVGAVGRMITDHGVSIVHDLVAQMSFWHVPGVIAVLVACGVVAIVVIDAGPARGRPADARALALALAAVTRGRVAPARLRRLERAARAAHRRLPGPLPAARRCARRARRAP